MDTSNLNIMDYPVRLLVAGSRNICDFKKFDFIIHDRVQMLLRGYPRDRICFISGRAAHGPDDMIDYWCEINGYPCFPYFADWDNLGKAAGHIRNREMGEVCNCALVLWDKVSPGTKGMIDILERNGTMHKVYHVKRSKGRHRKYREKDYGRQSEKSRTDVVRNGPGVVAWQPQPQDVPGDGHGDVGQGVRPVDQRSEVW